MKYESMIDRLLANSYQDEDECWIWIGSTKANAGGPRKGKPVTLQAHRVSYSVFMQIRITPKSVIRYRCDKTLCINPGHLIKGSQRDNVRDCVARGRHRNAYSEVL